MEVVILCGGLGTRLREETEFRPKPMVEIGGKPILWHVMKTYANYGYVDFILALGYKGEISCKSENNKFCEANLLHLDISKAVNKLKWRPKLDFADTVSYTIDEYKVGGMKRKEIYEQRIEHIIRYMDI